MQTSALFGAKELRIFRNLWCGRTDKEGLSRRGQFFAILFGRLLWPLKQIK